MMMNMKQARFNLESVEHKGDETGGGSHDINKQTNKQTPKQKDLPHKMFTCST